MSSFLIFVFCVALCVNSANSNKIASITFLKDYCEFNCAKEVSITTPTILSPIATDSFTVCLRARFDTWADTVLVSASGFALAMDNYGKGTGRVYIGEREHWFTWKGFIPLSLNSWNSFCFTYNAAMSNLTLIINRFQVFNAIEKKLTGLKKIGFSNIKLGSYFTGQISDLNIWSKVLSKEEIEQYSGGCFNDVVAKLRSDVFSWSAANFSFKNNLTFVTMIPIESFCPDKHGTEHTLLISPYDYNFKRCQKFNADMFYPRSESQLKLFIESVDRSILTNTCSGRIWVPFVRSSDNNTKWIYDGRKNLEEVSFEPWSKMGNDDNQHSKKCMYFDTVLKQYDEALCKGSYSNICIACELDDQRLLFNLKMECTETNIDRDYLMVRDRFTFRFAGVEGFTDIQQNSEFRIIYAREKNESLREAAVFPGFSTDPPAGIHNAYSTSVCNQQGEMEMKLSNVSKS
jgi:hypothetical protein